MRAEPGEGGRFSWLIALNTHSLTNGCYGSPPLIPEHYATVFVLTEHQNEFAVITVTLGEPEKLAE